jgi:hypothetical protein
MTTRLRLLIPAGILATVASCDANILSPTRQLSSGAAAARAVTPPPSLGTWPVSASQISLSWNDDQRNESGWEVQRSIAGAEGAFTLLERVAANSTSYSNTGLAPLTEYCYKVRSFKTSGPKTTFGTFTNVSCSQTFGPPAAPSDLQAVPGNSTDIDVSWKDNATTELSFRIERAPDPAGPWATVTTRGANTVVFGDGGRTPEQQVCYRVIAVNQHGESASNIDCTSPPRWPSQVAATGGSGSIAVTWTDASNVEDGYEVQRALDDFVFIAIASLPENTASYEDANVTPDTRYWYRVRATKDGGFSTFSSWASAVVAAGPPRAPEDVSATPGGSTGASVGWRNASPSATSFRIERSTDGRASWVTAGTTQDTWFGEGDRETEREVCYRVFAINSFGESPVSSVDCTAPPAAPTNISTAAQEDGAILVTWDDNSSVEDGYEIRTMICWYDYEYGWWCDYFNFYSVGANQTSALIYPYNDGQSVEQVVEMYAVSDGGYSDQGTWAGAAAASLVSAKVSPSRVLRPTKGMRVPQALVDARLKGVSPKTILKRVKK